MWNHDEFVRYRFLADALVLRTLCAQDAHERWDELRRPHSDGAKSRRMHFSIVNGYKLLINTALYSLLDSAINSPHIFGLQPDGRFWEWWAYNPSKRGIVSRSAFTDPASDLANLSNNFLRVMDTILRCDAGEPLYQVTTKVYSMSEKLMGMVSGCSMSVFNVRQDVPDINEALQCRAVERLLDYIEYDRTAEGAYSFVWRGGEEDAGQGSEVVWDDPFEGIETHLDRLIWLPRRLNSWLNWETGVVAAVCVSLTGISVEGDAAADTLAQLEYVGGTLSGLSTHLHTRVGAEWPSKRFGLRSESRISILDLFKLEDKQ